MREVLTVQRRDRLAGSRQELSAEACELAFAQKVVVADDTNAASGTQKQSGIVHRSGRAGPYASADLGAASDVTAKSILSEAASVSPAPAISPQRHGTVIAPAHGDGTPDRQYRFRWEARPGRGRRDDSVRARSPFADHVKT